jgi:hypothetical protein
MKKIVSFVASLFLVLSSASSIQAQQNQSTSSWFNFEGMSWFMQGSKFDASELSVSVKDYVQQSVYLGKVDSTSNVFYRLNSSYEFTMNGIPTRQFLIRNDSVNKRIYIRPLFDENIEHLLYDFSLKVGDTVKSIMLTNLKLPLIVSKVETVEINGIKRIQISALLKGGKSERTIKFIEGIGTTNGFLVLIDLSTKEAISLKCVHKNKTLIYNTDANCPEPELYLKPKRPGGK